jgi:hypothetical protein
MKHINDFRIKKIIDDGLPSGGQTSQAKAAEERFILAIEVKKWRDLAYQNYIRDKKEHLNIIRSAVTPAKKDGDQ